ncbi:MAG: hypothetical protein AAFO72_14055, partial [Pseudomonadota bacterium]
GHRLAEILLLGQERFTVMTPQTESSRFSLERLSPEVGRQLKLVGTEHAGIRLRAREIGMRILEVERQEEGILLTCLPSLHRPLRESGLTLRKPPRAPGAEELRNMGRKFPPNHLHESWIDFLYWDAELDA